MPTLADLANFDAGRSIQFGEAGAKRRTLAELGQYAASGNLTAAEATAWQGGMPDVASNIRAMAQEDQMRAVEAGAQFAMSATTPEAWESGRRAFEQQYGSDPGDFRMRDIIIQRAIPVVEAIRMQREDAERARTAAASADAASRKPPDISEFYDEATGQPYKAQWNPQTRSYERVGGVKAPSGMTLSTNPDGTMTMTQGSGMGGKLTEADGKSAIYATRAAGALPLINTYGDALTNLPQSFVGSAPVVGNYFRDSDFQRADQAGKEFLQAILRKDTGAAITAQETAEYGTVYLPRPGDSPELLAQKSASRDRALQALIAGMPPQAILNAERALGASMPAPPSSIGAPGALSGGGSQNQFPPMNLTTGEPNGFGSRSPVGGPGPQQPDQPRRYRWSPERGIE